MPPCRCTSGRYAWTRPTSNAYFGLAEAKARQGRFDEAIEARRKAHQIAGDDALKDVLATAKGEEGYRAIERAWVRMQLEALKARQATSYTSPLDFARVYAQLGDKEQAFKYLDAAFIDRSPGLVFLKVDHAWDLVRDDPRFLDAIRKVGPACRLGAEPSRIALTPAEAAVLASMLSQSKSHPPRSGSMAKRRFSLDPGAFGGVHERGPVRLRRQVPGHQSRHAIPALGLGALGGRHPHLRLLGLDAAQSLARIRQDDSLRKAGYRPVIVENTSELDQALKLGTWSLADRRPSRSPDDSRSCPRPERADASPRRAEPDRHRNRAGQEGLSARRQRAHQEPGVPHGDRRRPGAEAEAAAHEAGRLTLRISNAARVSHRARSICAPLVAVGVSLCCPRAAFAQAWPAPARVGAVSFVYQAVANTGHRLHDGSMLRGFDSYSQSLLINVDYAVSDRFSFAFGIPYLASKYSGPEPSLFLLPLDECHCWNHGWQDVAGTARYNFVNGAVALTPSVSVGTPSHNYEYQGEAVLGLNLNELRIAVDAGHRFAAMPRLSVSGRYSYAFVEKVSDLSINRSNFAIEPSYAVARKLTASAVFAWQRTHGGLRSNEFATEEQFVQFDRLIRDDNFHLGATVARTFRHVDVFGSYLHYVSGTDTHDGYAITVGVSFPFER